MLPGKTSKHYVEFSATSSDCILGLNNKEQWNILCTFYTPQINRWYSADHFENLKLFLLSLSGLL